METAARHGRRSLVLAHSPPVAQLGLSAARLGCLLSRGDVWSETAASQHLRSVRNRSVAISVELGGGTLNSRTFRLHELLSLAVLALAIARREPRANLQGSRFAHLRKQPPNNQETTGRNPRKNRWAGDRIFRTPVWRARPKTALKNGNYAAAVDYAQRAAQAAPDDPQLWFLLGYAARLAGKRSSPSIPTTGASLQSFLARWHSGLAQTYSKHGPTRRSRRVS